MSILWFTKDILEIKENIALAIVIFCSVSEVSYLTYHNIFPKGNALQDFRPLVYLYNSIWAPDPRFDYI
jgi:hypothetical protein